MRKKHSVNGVTVKAYKGDATTLLAFSLEDSLLQNFTGFSIKIELIIRATISLISLAIKKVPL